MSYECTILSTHLHEFGIEDFELVSEETQIREYPSLKNPSYVTFQIKTKAENEEIMETLKALEQVSTQTGFTFKLLKAESIPFNDKESAKATSSLSETIITVGFQECNITPRTFRFEPDNGHQGDTIYAVWVEANLPPLLIDSSSQHEALDCAIDIAEEQNWNVFLSEEEIKEHTREGTLDDFLYGGNSGKYLSDLYINHTGNIIPVIEPNE